MEALKEEKLLYQSLQTDIKENPYISASLILKWLQPLKELTDDMFIIAYDRRADGKQKIYELIVSKTSNIMKKEEIDIFRNEFTKLYYDNYGDIDKGKITNNLGAKLINQKLKLLKIPFRVKTQRGEWNIEELDGKDNE